MGPLLFLVLWCLIFATPVAAADAAVFICDNWWSAVPAAGFVVLASGHCSAAVAAVPEVSLLHAAVTAVCLGDGTGTVPAVIGDLVINIPIQAHFIVIDSQTRLHRKLPPLLSVQGEMPSPLAVLPQRAREFPPASQTVISEHASPSQISPLGCLCCFVRPPQPVLPK